MAGSRARAQTYAADPAVAPPLMRNALYLNSGGGLMREAASLAGLAALYAVGMPYMALILNAYMGKGMTFSALLWAGMLPYLPGDAVKIIVAAGVCPVLRRRLRLVDGSDKRGE